MSSYRFFADRPLVRYHKSDIGFSVCVIILCGLGIFTLCACSQNYADRMFGDAMYFVRRQCVCFAVGLAGLVLFASLRIGAIRKCLPLIVLGTFILCLLTFVPGISIEKNGARRWIRMPFSFTLQPSELAKFAVVLFLANLFDKQARIQNPNEKSVLPCVVGLTAFVVVVFLQKDFSTAVFIFGVGLILFLAAGMKVAWLGPLLLLAVPAMFLMITLEPYRLERIIAFIHPEEGIHTFNYQSIAAKRAISAGGFWGAGIGTALVQSNVIPEIQADYIFAGWAESMGFFGVLVYFAVLVAFTWRGYRAAFRCGNRFASYGAFGFVSVIFLQSVMNCAVVCGAVPTTGIPLPFFSLGGSSVITTLCMCGFVINASRCDTEEDAAPESEFTEIRAINGAEQYE